MENYDEKDLLTLIDMGVKMAVKDLKKAVKAKSEKELYLGLGWLLREDKIVCTATDKDYNFSLK